MSTIVVLEHSFIDFIIKSLLQTLAKYLSLYYLEKQNTYRIVWKYTKSVSIRNQVFLAGPQLQKVSE